MRVPPERPSFWLLQYAHDLGRTTPQAFQVVKLPLFWREYVDDDVAEVQKHPAGGRRAFPPVPHDPGILERLGQVLLQRLNLPGRLSRHYYKVIGERRKPPQIQQHDVFGQLVRSDINNELRYFQGFQRRFLRALGSAPPFLGSQFLL